MKGWVTFVWAFLAVSPALAEFSKECTGNEPAGEMIRQIKIGTLTYRMTYEQYTDRGRFSLLKNGKTVFSRIGSHFYINGFSSCGLPLAGTSITGKERAELAVMDWSGGAHCCNTLYLIALEDKPFLIQKISLGHSDAVFRDINGDGILELLISDSTFAYWKVPYAQSPSPDVVLRFDGAKWVFSFSLNRKSPPSSETVVELAREIAKGFDETRENAARGDQGETGAPVALWDEMLKLIYSGNASVALELADRSWPSTNSNKRRFLRQFRAQLAESPFFEALQQLNGNSFL